jgi:hypothetical protein
VAVVAVICGSAVNASAQCRFNAIASAKNQVYHFVRTQMPCVGTTQNPLGDLVTSGGNPACRGVQPFERPDYPVATPYQFRRDGGCRIRVKAEISQDCSKLKDSRGDSLFLAAEPCSNFRFVGRCQGLVGADGATLLDFITGFRLFAVLRISFNDGAAGDVTLYDFPIQFPFKTVRKGRMKLRQQTAERLQQGFVTPRVESALPTCTQVEILRMEILDPISGSLAAAGLGTVAGSEGGSSAQWGP